jgi:hypothetical protein
MNVRRDDEERADGVLDQLWHRLRTPDDEEFRSLARTASSGPQDPPPPIRRRVRSRRWAIAVVGAALLAASGLGFGLGASVTPSGSAGRNAASLGFLLGQGWDVVRTGGADAGATRAVASENGIVIAVTSTPRGDPAEDVGYESRELPLRIAEARRLPGDTSRFHLRAALGGYNVDVTISLGELSPTRAVLASAQAQLNRLVVAADRVTIGVRPAISSPTTVNGVIVFGTIDSGRAGESVTIQAKDCGTTFFRVFAGANTEQGGTWSTNIFPSVTTRLRAVWNGETSAEVIFRQRVIIGLQQRGSSRFRMNVGASRARFTGKPVTIQQFDQRIGQWKVAKRVRLTTDFYNYFTLRVPKGTQLRAVFPDALAKPCYLGATSSVIRT